MSVDRWNTVLVLGGIRSGKSAFAESLVEDAASVRYVATAAGGEDDPEWRARIEAHQRRRPQSWTTEETGADPARLAALLAEAKPDETLLVDDLGGWVADPAGPGPPAAATTWRGRTTWPRRCGPARPGWCWSAPRSGCRWCRPRRWAGRSPTRSARPTRRSPAACDAVVLVVAGQPTWLKPSPTRPSRTGAARGGVRRGDARAEIEPAESRAGRGPRRGSAGPRGTGRRTAPAETTPPPATRLVTPAAPAETRASPAADVLSQPTMTLPLVSPGLVIQPGMDLPMPDERRRPRRPRPARHPRPARRRPRPAARGGRVRRRHPGTARPAAVARRSGCCCSPATTTGGAAAGDDPAESSAASTQARGRRGRRWPGWPARPAPTSRWCDCRRPAPWRTARSLAADAVEAALRQGWQLADAAGDAGVDVLVLGLLRRRHGRRRRRGAGRDRPAPSRRRCCPG